MNIVSLKNSVLINITQFAVFAVLVCLKILMNVKSAKNLEFIQITRSSEFTPNWCPLALLLGEASSTSVENVRQIRLFMQNKPNFPPFLAQK